MRKVDELLKSSVELGISLKILSEANSKTYISNTLKKFNPDRTTGHLSIGESYFRMDTERYEFSFSKYLEQEPALIFFEQSDRKKSKIVLEIENATQVSSLFENAFGMEYFITNRNLDYLIAVNWYGIQVVGTAEEKLSDLEDDY